MTDTLRAALAEHGFHYRFTVTIPGPVPDPLPAKAPEGPAAQPLRQPGHPAIKELHRRWRVRLGLEQPS